MKYEIIRLDGLYCVFRKGKIESAFATKKEALDAIDYYKKGEKK